MPSTNPTIHLVIMQPAGYVHSLGFLDPARYLRHQFRRLGANVSLAKNRLREDAINIVFGAHLGFPPELQKRHTCVFFNLEQLGSGGASVSPEYLDLLRNSPTFDYDAANVASYCRQPAGVPVVALGHAPYLSQRSPTAHELAQRPIDLLFFGSINPRRRALIDRIEACGISVSVFDSPLYGPERDEYVCQAKAVLNCHFYDSSRFEQPRVANCLSLGTPVVSERRIQTQPGNNFESAVSWFDDATLETFFTGHFGSSAWLADAEQQLAGFRLCDPIDDYARVMAWAVELHESHCRQRDPAYQRPLRINLGSGRDYRAGWLNVDIIDRAEPDLVLDLGQPLSLPITRPTRFGGQVTLGEGMVDQIYANNVLEHVPDLPQLMGNALALLCLDGEFEIEVPYEKALTAWQDPTHLRAMNENSWVYYTDWFWYLGWFEHRFEIAASTWLDTELKPCTHEHAAFMKVRLRKVLTTPRERTTARAMRADFGGIDSDMGAAADIRVLQQPDRWAEAERRLRHYPMGEPLPATAAQAA